MPLDRSTLISNAVLFFLSHILFYAARRLDLSRRLRARLAAFVLPYDYPCPTAPVPAPAPASAVAVAVDKPPGTEADTPPPAAGEYRSDLKHPPTATPDTDDGKDKDDDNVSVATASTSTSTSTSTTTATATHVDSDSHLPDAAAEDQDQDQGQGQGQDEDREEHGDNDDEDDDDDEDDEGKVERVTAAETLIVFDWDDTLFPTRAVHGQSLLDVLQAGGDDVESASSSSSSSSSRCSSPSSSSSSSDKDDDEDKDDDKDDDTSTTTTTVGVHVDRQTQTVGALADSLRLMERVLMTLLRVSRTLGTVVVVTNASLSWVDETAGAFVRDARALMADLGIDVVSAHDRYCEDGEHDRAYTSWKTRAIAAAVARHFDGGDDDEEEEGVGRGGEEADRGEEEDDEVEAVEEDEGKPTRCVNATGKSTKMMKKKKKKTCCSNIITVGDSEQEHNAAVAVARAMAGCYCKTVWVKQLKTPKQHAIQLCAVTEKLADIALFARDMDVKV